MHIKNEMINLAKTQIDSMHRSDDDFMIPSEWMASAATDRYQL